jgi:plastocyanin
MFTMKTFAATLLIAAAGVSAAPTSTGISYPSRTVAETGVTHTVVAGRAGLHFDPENVVAQIGDVIEWHYLPMNHSVAQSSFGNPCKPLDDGSGFFSGFNFFTKEGQAPDVFTFTVVDQNPIWYYCAQQTGAHCQMGMAGVINQNFNSNVNTLANYKLAAAKTGVSIIPPNVQGGNIFPNPNPTAGV